MELGACNSFCLWLVIVGFFLQSIQPTDAKSLGGKQPGLQLDEQITPISSKLPKNLLPSEYEILGPFPHVDGGADVLNAFGGIWEAYSHRVRSRVPSTSAGTNKDKNDHHVVGEGPHRPDSLKESSSALEGHAKASFAEKADLTSVAQAFQDQVGLPPKLSGDHGFILLEQAAKTEGISEEKAQGHQETTTSVGRSAYPSEVAPGGLASWAPFAMNFSDWEGQITFDYTEVLKDAGRQVSGRRMWTETPSFGWAVGKFKTTQDSTVLARCDTPFLVDFGQIFHTPDVYHEHRAISSLNLEAGEHVIALMVPDGGFWCELFEDTVGKPGSEVRQNMTNVPDGSNATSPLVLLSDGQMSDVVDGLLASDHLSIPVLNTLAQPLQIGKVSLVGAPSWLELEEKTIPPIAPGQQIPLRLDLKQAPHGKSLNCSQGKPFELTVRFEFEDDAPQERTLHSQCVGAFEGSGGFLVTYPDFDGSIQRAWVAPPNLSQAEAGSCPKGGCPILLSLHGADVTVDGLGPRTFGYGGGSFPYAAWLVMPTNRWHWGTDWEGQGLDNAIAAMRYVRKNLPGLDHIVRVHRNANDGLEVEKLSELQHLKASPEVSAAKSDSRVWLAKRQERYKPHLARVLLHGHSMGGHGCYLLGAHFPDGLMGMACAAGWSSMASSHARLLDGTREGLRHAPLAEHSADLLASNLFGIPFLVTYGDQDDNVAPDEPRYMARLVRSFSNHGSAIVLREERGIGHWFMQNTPAVDAFFRHLLHGEGPPAEATRVAAAAAHVVDTTAEVAAARAMADSAEKEATEAIDRARAAKAHAESVEAAASETAPPSSAVNFVTESESSSEPPDGQLRVAAHTQRQIQATIGGAIAQLVPGDTPASVNIEEGPRKHASSAFIERFAATSDMTQEIASETTARGQRLPNFGKPGWKGSINVRTSTQPETLMALAPEDMSKLLADKEQSASSTAATALEVSRVASVAKLAAMTKRNNKTSSPNVISIMHRNRSLVVDYSTVLAAMRDLTSKAPPPSALPRELPALPPYFEFVVTNPATFGTKGNLQLLQLGVPQAPAKFLVSRQSGVLLENSGMATLALRTPPGAKRMMAGEVGGGALEIRTAKDPTTDTLGEIWVVRTYNVRRFRLKHPPIPGVPTPEVLIVDGTEFRGSELGGAHAPAGRHFCRHHEDNVHKWRVCDGTSWASLQRGTPLQGGPLQMTIRRAPVCIVHQGSTDSSEQHAVSLANRMYFVSRYMPIVFDGNKIGLDDPGPTRSCARDSNLILLGHAEHNRWSRDLACAFRYVKFLKGGGYVLNDERYTEPKSGILAMGGSIAKGHVHGHRVLLAAGTDEAGLAQAVRNVPVSSGQLTPDFNVYGSRATWAGAGGLLAAGFVDHQWQVPGGSLSFAFAEPEPPQLVASGRDGATLLQRLASWGVKTRASDSDFLLGPDACKAEELAAIKSDEELQGGDGSSQSVQAATSGENSREQPSTGDQNAGAESSMTASRDEQVAAGSKSSKSNEDNEEAAQSSSNTADVQADGRAEIDSTDLHDVGNKVVSASRLLRSEHSTSKRVSTTKVLDNEPRKPRPVVTELEPAWAF